VSSLRSGGGRSRGFLDQQSSTPLFCPTSRCEDRLICLPALSQGSCYEHIPYMSKPFSPTNPGDEASLLSRVRFSGVNAADTKYYYHDPRAIG